MKALIERDNATCQYCGKKADYIEDTGLTIKAIEVYTYWRDKYTAPFEPDHIIPKCQGGETNYKNLKLSCRRCNRKKGSKERKYEMVSA